MTRLIKYLTLAVLSFAGIGCNSFQKSDINEFRIERVNERVTQSSKNLTRVFNYFETETDSLAKRLNDEQARTFSWRQESERRMQNLDSSQSQTSLRVDVLNISLNNLEKQYKDLNKKSKELEKITTDLIWKHKELTSKDSNFQDELSALDDNYWELSESYKELTERTKFLIRGYRDLDKRFLAEQENNEKAGLRYRKLAQSFLDYKDKADKKIRELRERLQKAEEAISNYLKEKQTQGLDFKEPVETPLKLGAGFF
ncbi:hypothetical protein DRN73_04080 [Candidatus Pacearchaeota archaeon]|nr:MAG: hypothetical protein DRN73_04080 [Candidatus Pacearchaeota archaeon]